MRSLLALDLDGTVVDARGSSTARLNQLLAGLESCVTLVYATGRNVEGALRLIEASGLARPAFLITDVGNRVFAYNGTDLELDQTYESFSARCWASLRLPQGGVSLHPFARAQESLTARRLAYWVTSESAAASASALFRRACPWAGDAIIRSDDSTSGGARWLDVLPPVDGKGGAVSYVAALLGIPHRHVFAVGDSLNDLEMLDGRFAAGAPASASRALLRALAARKTRLKLAAERGSMGTFKVIEEWLQERHNEDAYLSPKGFNGGSTADTQQGDISEASCPNSQRNWGIRPGRWRRLSVMPDRDEVLTWMNRGQNWWWRYAEDDERARIMRRYHLIPREFLLPRLSNYASNECNGARLLGAMVSGSFLYGAEEDYANDLDLVLLMKGLGDSTVGIEISMPGLLTEMRGCGHRLRFDRVGLGLVDIADVTLSNNEPVFLQIAASMEGSGVPLFGQTAIDASMSAFDLLTQAEKLLQDAQSYIDCAHEERSRKVLQRCVEVSRVLDLVCEDIGKAPMRQRSQQWSSASDSALVESIRNSRLRKAGLLLAWREHFNSRGNLTVTGSRHT